MCFCVCVCAIFQAFAASFSQFCNIIARMPVGRGRALEWFSHCDHLPSSLLEVWDAMQLPYDESEWQGGTLEGRGGVLARCRPSRWGLFARQLGFQLFQLSFISIVQYTSPRATILHLSLDFQGLNPGSIRRKEWLLPPAQPLVPTFSSACPPGA